MDRQTWDGLIDEFEEHLRAERSLAELTIRNYLTDLQPLHDYMTQRRLTGLDQIDRTSVRGYLAWLTELGYVRRSIARKLSTLRGFLRWLVRKGVLQADPLPRRGVMKLDSRLPRFLSQDEAARLVLSPDASEPLGARDRALLELIYAAGLRVSEVRGLNVGNIDLASRELRVTGKGSKQRAVLIGEAARSALSVYLNEVRPKLAGRDSGNALFLNRFGGRPKPTEHPGQSAALRRPRWTRHRRPYAHAAPLLRHPPPRRRRRPQSRPGAARPRQPGHHAGLYPRHRVRGKGRLLGSPPPGGGLETPHAGPSARHTRQSFPSIPTLRPRQYVAIGLDNPVRELTVPAHVSAYCEIPCRCAAETG